MILYAPPIIDLKNRWVISDTHFFHQKLLTFEKEGGHKCRSEFSDVHHMNETIVERWNARVKPGEKVWHLGDVVLGLSGSEYESTLHPLLSRLNGKKNLCHGNHDKVKHDVIRQHFKEIVLWKMLGPFTLTHIPQRLDQLRRQTFMNIHGHLHEELIDEPQYFNVCCEQTNYAPVHIEEIAAEARKRGLL